MRKDGYVVVQPWMVTDYNLNGNKLLIYALIWGFSQDEQSCFYGSVSYIVEYFKLSKRAVLNLLAELEKDPHRRQTLMRIMHDEKRHCAILESRTGREMAPDPKRVFWYVGIMRVLGPAFVVRQMESCEKGTEAGYSL